MVGVVSNPANRQISVWVPEVWDERVNEAVSASGLTRSEWFRNAIRDALGPELSKDLPGINPAGNPVLWQQHYQNLESSHGERVTES